MCALGVGGGEEGYLKMRVRSNKKGGQGRRFESIVTTEVPTALTEVAAAPLERRTHPHAGRSHSHNNNLAATATGIKRALEATRRMCVVIKGWR